jgi:ABC-type dipeptide/oligopeptide/nickel transport system ATPase component
MSIIEVKNLNKEFKIQEKEKGIKGSIKSIVKPKYKEINAVDNISFSVEKGEILAFIGPNGAGKSTTIKMLTGILYPTSGNIEVMGLNPSKQRKQLAYKIGTVDYVLTFEECAVIFIAMGIEPSQFENMETEGSFDGWNFAQSGGVARAVENICNKKLTIEKMNGISEGKELFKKAKLEKIDLIEGMACEGGCICGPGIMVNPNSAKIALQRMVLNKG